MIKTLIIDDEKNAQEALSSLLELFCPTVQVVGTAETIESAKVLIEELQPELIFLDVHLGDFTGFNLLEGLVNLSFQIIFTTGHSDYAIQAFRHNAIDYLLKPIEPSLLVQAVKKVADKLSTQLDVDRIQNLLASLQSPAEKITISTAQGYHILDVDQIIRIEGDGNYSTFYVEQGEKVISSKKLKSYIQQLPSQKFVQTHQSHLVNVAFVRKMLFEDGGFLLLKDASKIPLARRRKEAVKEALQIRVH